MQIFRLIRAKIDWLAALARKKYCVPKARVFDYQISFVNDAPQPNTALRAKQLDAYQI
jgi:hypothetical protein